MKNANDLYQYLAARMEQGNRYYLFLDEIQEVEGFEKALNSLNIEYTVDIYVTGSNSHLLSGELASQLTGRFFSIDVFPLSLAEILQDKETHDVNTEFIKYVRYGGMPAVQRFPDQADLVAGYLSDVYSSILLKDIVSRYSIRDVDLLERFVRYVMQNIGKIFSASSIARFLKNESRSLSRETIYQYLNACKNAFLIYGVPRFDIRGKNVLKTCEKYFVNDLGLRGVYFDNEADIAQSLENIVYLELLRQGYQVYVGQIDAAEVDFIAIKGKSRWYIQVAYLLASPETIEREFSALEAIPDNFPKAVLSLDPFDRGRNGIANLNIVDFLTGKRHL